MGLILVTRHLPLALLRASRQVYDESHTIVSSLVKIFIQESQPRVIGTDIRLNGLRGLMRPIVRERDDFCVR
jgi:hypothetical protein